jgi:hypothetical protein
MLAYKLEEGGQFVKIYWYDPSVGTPIGTIASYGLTFNEAAIDELKNANYMKLG